MAKLTQNDSSWRKAKVIRNPLGNGRGWGTRWDTEGDNLLRTGSEVKVAQLCLILCDHVDYTAHGILQARILEWVAFPLSLPNQVIKLRFPSNQADSLPVEPPEKPTENRASWLNWLHRIPTNIEQHREECSSSKVKV